MAAVTILINLREYKQTPAVIPHLLALVYSFVAGHSINHCVVPIVILLAMGHVSSAVPWEPIKLGWTVSCFGKFSEKGNTLQSNNIYSPLCCVTCKTMGHP